MWQGEELALPSLQKELQALPLSHRALEAWGRAVEETCVMAEGERPREEECPLGSETR